MNKNGFFGTNVVRKSPVVIVKTFLILQMTAVAVFFFSGILLDYGEIYDHLPLPTSLSYHIVEAIALFGLETLIVFYIFFRWHKEYYDIKGSKIIHSKGIIFGRKTVIPLSAVSSISYRQGPLGRLTKYGDIELKDRVSGDNFVMDHIPEPQNYTEFLVQIHGSIDPNEFRDGRLSIEDLLSSGEHEHLEFKTSFRWDVNQNKVNKNLERAIMKTIVAFLNSNGGHLLIGVDDSATVIGLENDYRSLPKANADSFQNHFTNVFHAMIGPEYRQYIELKISKMKGKDCCLIKVASSEKPAYLKLDGNEEFYIRTGNGTTSLKLSEAASYIDSRWKGKLL